jgi:hypothetical protein
VDREGDGLKASQSPARKRRGGRQTEPTYYPTIAEKRKGGKSRMESKLVVDLDEGKSVDAASGPNPPAHHYWSKDVGKQKGDWELEDAGWRPKETGRESRGAEKQRW